MRDTPTSFKLEAIEHAVGMELSEHALLDAINPEVAVRRTAHSLVVTLRARVFSSNEATYDERVKYPFGWWEAFKHAYKQRWWMCWYVRRNPILYRVHEFTARGRLKFPEIPRGFRESNRYFSSYDSQFREFTDEDPTK